MRHSSRRNKNGKSSYQGGTKKLSKTRVYESNGPEVKIRGTAWQVTEKYHALAKDAESSGNWVLAESYYQHAEHYQRIISSFEEEQQSQPQKKQSDKDEDSDFESIVASKELDCTERETVAA